MAAFDGTVAAFGMAQWRQLMGTVATIDGTVAVFDGMAQWLRLMAQWLRLAWHSGDN